MCDWICSSFLDLLLECHCVFKKRALRLASQIIFGRIVLNMDMNFPMTLWLNCLGGAGPIQY